MVWDSLHNIALMLCLSFVKLLSKPGDFNTTLENSAVSTCGSVIGMDISLKKVLIVPQMKLRKGFGSRFRMGVFKLGSLAKENLKSLKRKISDLKEGVESSEENHQLADHHLKTLADKLYGLENVTGSDFTIQKIGKALQTKFRSQIQEPINTAIQQVESILGELGGNFRNLKAE
ncbi:hypothetical protein BBBOND_0201680 [Babesia bigemina]|uniref:Uncharacterized protein n=1 Tax=Babesia bigemina TaxID=5866 RepID=A0A061D2K4_BABBI|nr:hypothetical protein BBBOND_0201680 [Babesia bigemina]CDR95011.1 hypothetical protein BBBOND_0201680 [Babesia bigemina]|eukprot:XP_012767197.1 hypothetical protein BBBOND_0201680 [Babesia bigemina]